MKVGHIAAGSAAWIPYGYQLLAVSTKRADALVNDTDVSAIFVQPYLAASLASACESIKVVTDSLGS